MAILPGATLGILGGGQLARMGAMAARAMGYRVAVLDPDPKCCAAPVADTCIVAALDDVTAAASLAGQVAVVTYDIEKIGRDVTRVVSDRVPLRPGGHVVRMVQDRATQKTWLQDHGFPVGRFAVVDDAEQIDAVLRAWYRPGRLKTRHGGYDGRGQTRCERAGDGAAAWQRLGTAPCILEEEQQLAAELSVLVARRPSGQVALHPVAQNWHHNGILSHSVIPADLPEPVIERARTVATSLAEALALEGLLAVEFFVTVEGDIWINELAPRPHNTFHQADAACSTSQFEQWIRAVCDLPLGSTDVVRPVALANLLGDLWEPELPNFARALQQPAVQLRLYDKQPRAGRKMGHLLAAGDSAQEAVQRVLQAKAALSTRP